MWTSSNAKARPEASAPARGAQNLSERGSEILECLVQGASNKMIANRLNITEGTVKVHMKSLLRKIDAANRTQAAIWALNAGYSNTVEGMRSEEHTYELQSLMRISYAVFCLKKKKTGKQKKTSITTHTTR